LTSQFFSFKSNFYLAALISMGAAACTTQELRKNGVEVYIQTAVAEIHENEEPGSSTIVVGRNSADTPIQVRLVAEGEAKPEIDYIVEGATFENDKSLTVKMDKGQSSVELVVTAIDDVAAEAGETLRLKPEKSDQYSVNRKDNLAEIRIPQNDFIVTSTNDSGEGSLRQALLNANAIEGPDEIRFDSENGPFGPPQEIAIKSALPMITDDLTLDGFITKFLWQKAGVILSGADSHRILSVERGVSATIKNLTFTKGRARTGGGIINRGKLVVSGITFLNNNASKNGGAIANLGGDLWVINSTLTGNRAKRDGGGIANMKGTLTVTNSTLSENASRKGGAVFNRGSLVLNNTILANSDAQQDCFSANVTNSAGTHNIIEMNEGCPGVLFEKDPGLGSLNYYNGMTQTIPLDGLSLAMNSGDNASAVDENNVPLHWDQRGNGDPRFVAGITDIGAFEVQANPKLIVDTLDDSGPQGCSGMRGDCPLRAALRLAELNDKPDIITFDTQVFSKPQELVLEYPLDVPTTEILIDASNVAHVRVRLKDSGPVFESQTLETLETRGLEIE
jgi:hypothetical protein